MGAILHADLDAFYASVEQLLRPELRGRPIAVGGGVVLAASYEAKAFGVRGGMPGRTARELCPDLEFVQGSFSEYTRLADEVISVMEDFTPMIERISIDEAFMDVRGSVHLFGTPAEIARSLRERVRTRTGLPISVGVASTKHLAKIASQVAKPDGLVVVADGLEEQFLAPLPVGLIWGVGPVTRGRLAEAGIETIGQLAEVRPSALRGLVGDAAGDKLHALSRNVDHRDVDGGPRSKSVGAQSALGRRDVTDSLVTGMLRHLADRVASRLRAKHRAGRTITVRIRFPDLRAITRSTTLDAPVSSTQILARVAEDLVRGGLADAGADQISLLAISVSSLVHEEALQLELPFHLGGEELRPGTEEGAARWAADRSVDAIRERFGRKAVGYASGLEGPGSVPDEFRELAEKG